MFGDLSWRLGNWVSPVLELTGSVQGVRESIAAAQGLAYALLLLNT